MKICFVNFVTNNTIDYDFWYNLWYLNVVILVKALNDIGVKAYFATINEDYEQLIALADIVIVYRPENELNTNEMLTIVKFKQLTRNKLLFINIDDNFFYLNSNIRDLYYSESLIEWCKVADGIIVPNKSFASALPFRLPVIVRETALSLKDYNLLKNNTKHTNGHFRICYTGNTGRASYSMPIIYKIIERLNAIKFDYQLVLYSDPSRPEYEILKQLCSNLETLNFSCKMDDYYWSLCKLNCNVMINPIVNHASINAKSPLKFVEAAALDMPIISSPIDSYVEIIKDGQNGFIANTIDEFVEKLVFIKNNDVTSIVSAARSLSEERFIVENQAHKFVENVRAVQK